LPLNRVGELNKIGKAFSKLEQEYERKPNAQELAQELDMDVEDVANSLQLYGRHISVDAPFQNGDDNKNNLLDVMVNDEQPSPDVSLMGESLRNEVQNVLSTLSEKEADVLRLYFGINSERSATLEEIGEKFNLTRERVRQIKEKAIRTLRHAQRTKNLRSYLG
jgi:RNA polymerase primary sigma factor